MKLEPMKPHPPVTSTFIGLASRLPSCSAKQRFAAQHEPPASRPASYQPDLRAVADPHPVDPRPLVARVNAHVRPDERVRDPSRNALEARALQHDRVLDLATIDDAVG